MTVEADLSSRISERFRWFERHSAFAIAGLFAVTTGVLLMRVAHGNASTALGVLQAGGTSATLMGSALTIAPYFGVILLGSALTFVWMRDPSWTPMNTWSRVGWTALVLLVASMFLSIVHVPVAVVLAIVASRGKSEAKGSTASLVMLIVVWLVFIAGPWWPLERVEVENAKHPVVGYVISATGDDLAVLLDSPRRLVHVASSESRRICTKSGLDALTRESVWSLILDRGGYSPCDE